MHQQDMHGNRRPPGFSNGLTEAQENELLMGQFARLQMQEVPSGGGVTFHPAQNSARYGILHISSPLKISLLWLSFFLMGY